MRQADDGTFQHAGLLVQHQLDFLRVDVIAPRDDQILLAANDADVTVSADLTDISGDEEPVFAQFLAGFLGHFPIAFEHVGAAHLDHAGFALRHLFARIGIGDLHLHPWQREAHCARAALAVIGVRGVHIGLGHAVAFQDPVASARLELLMRFCQKRRGARGEQAYMANQITGE